jgi:hypothetical protein
MVQIVTGPAIVAMWDLPYLHHNIGAAAMAKTCLQYLLSLIHRLHIYQHQRYLRLSILFFHRVDSDIAGPRVEMGWITIVITVVHLISHVTIMIIISYRFLYFLSVFLQVVLVIEFVEFIWTYISRLPLSSSGI